MEKEIQEGDNAANPVKIAGGLDPAHEGGHGPGPFRFAELEGHPREYQTQKADDDQSVQESVIVGEPQVVPLLVEGRHGVDGGL